MSVKLQSYKDFWMFINDKFLFFLCVNLLNPESLPTYESVFYEREHVLMEISNLSLYMDIVKV